MVDLARLKLELDNSSFNSKLKQSTGAVNSFSKISISSFAKVGVAIYALKQAFNGLSTFWNASVTAKTMQNVFNTTFENIIDKANDAATALSSKFGASITTINAALANTGDLLTGLQFDTQSALTMSVSLTDIAGKLALFRNLDLTDVTERFTKGILGETESLKLLGIKIDQTSKAYRNSIVDIMAATGMTKNQSKAQAILNQIIKQSPNAIKGFADASEGLVGQSFRLNEAWKDFKITLGDVLTDTAQGTSVIDGLTSSLRGLVSVFKLLGGVGIAATGASVTALIGGVSAGASVMQLKNSLIGLDTQTLSMISTMKNFKDHGLLDADAIKGFVEMKKEINSSEIALNKAAKNAAILQGTLQLIGATAAGIALGKLFIGLKADSINTYGDKIQMIYQDTLSYLGIYSYTSKEVNSLNEQGLALDKERLRLITETATQISKMKQLTQAQFDFKFNFMNVRDQMDMLIKKRDEIGAKPTTLKNQTAFWKNQLKIENLREKFNKLDTDANEINRKWAFDQLSVSEKILDVQKRLNIAKLAEANILKNADFSPDERLKALQKIDELRRQEKSLVNTGTSTTKLTAPQHTSTSVSDAVRKGTLEGLKLENTYIDKTKTIENNTKDTANNTKEANSLLVKMVDTLGDIFEKETVISVVDPLTA